MADEASLRSVIENQKKLSKRLNLMETTVQQMFNTYCHLLGDQVPQEIQRLQTEWEEIEHEGEVVIKNVRRKVGVTVSLVCFNLEQTVMTLFLLYIQLPPVKISSWLL